MSSDCKLGVVSPDNESSSSLLDINNAIECSNSNLEYSRKKLGSSALNLVHHQIELVQVPIHRTASNRQSGDRNGCYSWLILLSSAMLQCVAFSPCIVSGIFYTVLIEEYSEHQTAFLWASSLQASLIFFAAPLVALLIDLTSGRFAAMAGCIGSGLSLAILSLSINVEVKILAIILSGLLSSCSYVPACTHAVQFFVKYRILAIAISTVTIPIGYLLVPPFVSTVIQLYGWREAYMAIALFNIQAAPLAMLLREPKDGVTYASSCSDSHSNSQFSSDHSLSLSLSLERPDREPFKEIQVELVGGVEVMQLPCSHYCEPSIQLSASKEAAITDMFKGNLTEKQSLISSKHPKPQLSLSEGHRAITTEYRATVLHWRVYLMIGACFLWGCSNLFYILLPAYVKQNGLLPLQTATLFMIGGLASFATRILIAITGHLLEYNKVIVAMGGMLLISTALFGLTLTTSFSGYAVAMSLFSTGFSLNVCLGNALTLELHGEYRLALLFGLQMFAFGTGSAVATLFAGLFDSLDISFYTVSALCVVGGAFYLPHVILLYKNKCFHPNS